MILLEKERAIAGGANFGHAPRNDNWNDFDSNALTTVESSIIPMHKSLVVQFPTNSSKPMQEKDPERQIDTSPIKNTSLITSEQLESSKAIPGPMDGPVDPKAKVPYNFNIPLGF